MWHFLILAICVFPLASCGTKGKLKTPSQIAHEQEKKERRQAKEEAKETVEGQEPGQEGKPND